MELSKDYPFLSAGIEDYVFAIKISEGRNGNKRHSVCLMHDAIEFILYEILILQGHDIYKDGQNTIGLNKAIEEFKNLYYEIPLINSIRTIQKLRGDAKHHAQLPSELSYSKILSDFRIIVSIIVYENFGTVLGEYTRQLDLLPYHVALYNLYRKYRNHNWSLALQFIIGALVNKHRAIMKISIEFCRIKESTLLQIIKAFENESKKVEYPILNKNVISAILNFPDAFRELFNDNNQKEASELAGKLYSNIDGLLPSIFDIENSKKITENLYRTYKFNFGKAMSWSKWFYKDTEQKAQILDSIKRLLKSNPKFVKTFEQPFYETDFDRYWRWWEFAFFDGEKWYTFHLDDNYEILLESGKLDEDDSKQRENLAQLIYNELSCAINNFNKLNLK